MVDMNSSKIFQEHMQYIANDDIEGMIRNTYTEDAIFYNTFSFLPGGAPQMIKGQDAIIKAFREYLEYQGIPQYDPPFNYIETEDYITFQNTYTSKSGKWAVSEVWGLRDGKVAHHFGLAYKVDDLVQK